MNCSSVSDSHKCVSSDLHFSLDRSWSVRLHMSVLRSHSRFPFLQASRHSMESSWRISCLMAWKTGFPDWEWPRINIVLQSKYRLAQFQPVYESYSCQNHSSAKFPTPLFRTHIAGTVYQRFSAVPLLRLSSPADTCSNALNSQGLNRQGVRGGAPQAACEPAKWTTWTKWTVGNHGKPQLRAALRHAVRSGTRTLLSKRKRGKVGNQGRSDWKPLLSSLSKGLLSRLSNWRLKHCFFMFLLHRSLSARVNQFYNYCLPS